MLKVSEFFRQHGNTFHRTTKLSVTNQVGSVLCTHGRVICSSFTMVRSIRHRRYSLSCKSLFKLLLCCYVRSAIVASAIIIDDTFDATTGSTSAAKNDNNFKVLTREQLETYHNDGYLYVKRGLLPAHLLDELATAVQKSAIIASKNKHSSGGYFSLLQVNNIFLPSSTTETNSTHNPTNNIYRKVVMDSIIPKAVSELMNLDPNNGDNLRCLRCVPQQ